MNVSLTPELEVFVNQKVASGMYQTASEVVRDGLRLLRERDELHQSKIEELRKAIALGQEEADRGEVGPLNEETIQRLKARGNSRRKQGK